METGHLSHHAVLLLQKMVSDVFNQLRFRIIILIIVLIIIYDIVVSLKVNAVYILITN